MLRGARIATAGGTGSVPSVLGMATLLLLMISVSPVWGQCDGNELQKLVASDGAVGDNLGASVAVDGTVAVAGAPADDDAGSDTGAAYVYRFDGSTWVEEQKLVAGDAAGGAEFGFAVAVSGDVIVVGAPFDDALGTDSGAVYVFRFDGLVWVEEQKLTAGEGGSAGDNLGYSVSVDGDAAVAGARLDDPNGNNDGSAYVFRFDGLTWAEEQRLTAIDGDSNDFFGAASSIDGDAIAVGAYLDDDMGTDSGSIYIYRFDGLTWTEEQKVIAAVDGDASDFFGFSVSLSGDAFITGAYGEDDAGTSAGAAYVFRFDGLTWNEEQRISASDADTDDFFGYTVSLDGSAAVVGSYRNDGVGNNSGSAYVFRYDGAAWAEEQKITASDAASDDNYGISAAIGGDLVAVGAHKEDVAGSNSGAVYVHEPCPTTCLTGTVNDAVGPVVDVLYVNGSTGGADRGVEVAQGDLIWAAMLLPPAQGTGKFVVHANFGQPTLGSLLDLPFDIGSFCFPMFLPQGATPTAIWNNIGKTAKVGSSQYFDGTPIPDPGNAPEIFLELFDGDLVNLPAGTIVTFQGVVLDPGSTSSKGASTTNAVVLTVQ